MRYLSIVLAVILCACSRNQPQPVTAAATPAKTEVPDFVVIPAQVQKESGVVTQAVLKQAVPEAVRSTARITNDENQTWRVGSLSEGRIVRIHANQGDMVRKDQVLAELHSHDIHESRAEYKKAKADLARYKGVVEFSTRVRDRAKRLYNLKAGSLEQLERVETELQNAKTDVTNAVVELERTEHHLTEVLGIPAEESDLPPSPDGEDNDLIPVRSPASGVVLARNVTPGTVTTASMDFFLVSDLSKLWAIAEVNEEFLGKLRVGMPVRIFVQAYGQEPFLGRIGRLGETLDPATRTVKVRVELANPKGRLKPEMYATTEIQIGGAEPAAVVPSEAVQEVRGQPSVFVKQGEDRFQVRPVRLGRSIDNAVEVLSGVTPGEIIAVRATFILKSEFLKSSMQ